MKPYEFKRFYHPKLGKFVFQHKGSGLILDNIFKPLKSVASSVFKKIAKPLAKKALESGFHMQVINLVRQRQKSLET